MATQRQGPKPESPVIRWLLESDPLIRWQRPDRSSALLTQRSRSWSASDHGGATVPTRVADGRASRPRLNSADGDGASQRRAKEWISVQADACAGR
jgi:hypothetical protein